jgi:Ser/Thr protein kinase RdoA (MazF antagonist)
MTTTAKAHGLDGTLVEPDWAPLTLDELRSLLDQFPECGEPLRILSTSPRPFSAAGVVAVDKAGTGCANAFQSASGVPRGLKPQFLSVIHSTAEAVPFQGPIVHGAAEAVPFQDPICATGGRVFVKRHHRAVRDAEGLAEEHRFLTHLRASGASVPRVLATASGQTAIECGDWTYEVHDIPEGCDLYEDALSWTPFRTATHAYSAGEALARLHLASRNFTAPPRKPRPLVASFTIFAADDPYAEMVHYLAQRRALRDDAATLTGCGQALDLLAPFHAELLPLLPALSPLWTHNDLHASNLFWSESSPDARATAIIDFGLADRTNAVHDIAHAIERNIVEWLALMQSPDAEVPVHIDHLHALLSGYESVRPLSVEESAALAPMVALCHAEFALTEADYFLGVLHSPEKARLASIDYLVGHANWFHKAAGKHLLNELRNWASSRGNPQKEMAQK